MIVAIIPARGGSKRIPRKNIRDFHGRPVIAYSIKAALESKLFDIVMVSTDDQEIARVARYYGAEVPFLRSDETADDYATTADVLAEVIAQFRSRGIIPDIVACIYPTAPFVTPCKLVSAYDRLLETQMDCVLPIARFDFPIWRSFQRDGDRISYNWPKHAQKRSQDLPSAFHDAGQFYFFRAIVLEQTGSFINNKTVGIEVSSMEVQDIDTLSDWKMAELKYRELIDSGVSRQ